MLGKRKSESVSTRPLKCKKTTLEEEYPGNWTVAVLKAWLRQNKLPVSGNKSTIVARVKEEMEKSKSSTTSSPTEETKVEQEENKKEKRKHITIETEYPPKNWDEMYQTIKEQRKELKAPIDEIGVNVGQNNVEGEKTKRYHYLIAHLLSGQTKDEVTAAAMDRLKAYPLTIKTMTEISLEDLQALIKPVRFYARKAQYIKDTTKVLVAKYDGDIPRKVEDIKKLKGIGDKMAYGIANHAWEDNFGICVDVHLHRIVNRLGWVKTSCPEESRVVSSILHYYLL